MTTVYPHEDAANLGLEKSEEMHREWKDYWEFVRVNKRAEGFVNVTRGTSVNWKNGVSKNIVTDFNDSNKETKKLKKDDGGRRWVFALRHGERVDITYGQWVPYCFDENGSYVQKDLNMPLQLADRVGGKDSYLKDTPLTRVGLLQGQLVGEGLRRAGIKMRHVYASAALRSVETAHALLLGLQPDPSVKIRVEPGLFECKDWHAAKGIAPFMTPEELHRAGYNVDLEYKPYVDLDIKTSETFEEFYTRVENVMQSAVKDTEEEGGNIMFVGHSCTLDMMVVALKRLDTMDRQDHPPYELNLPLMNRIPYCGLAAMKSKPWQVVPPPCPPAMNSSSGRFEWELLMDVWKNA